MGFVSNLASKVGNAVSSVVSNVGHAVEGVGEGVGDVLQGNIGKGLHEALPGALMAAGAIYGIPALGDALGLTGGAAATDLAAPSLTELTPLGDASVPSLGAAELAPVAEPAAGSFAAPSLTELTPLGDASVPSVGGVSVSGAAATPSSGGLDLLGDVKAPVSGLRVAPGSGLDLVGSTPEGMPLPSAPNLVGEGTPGLTLNTSQGVLGAYGLTPTGASPILGDASSFINNPANLGKPVVGYGTPDDPVSAGGSSLLNTIGNGLKALSPSSQGSSGSASNSDSGGGALSLAPGMGASRYLSPTEIATRAHGVLNLLPQLQQLRAVAQPSSGGMSQQMLSLLMARTLGQPYGYKRGGAVGGEESHPHKIPGVPLFRTGGTGRHVQGPGDGQSDDIPAMLADGEYVFDADTVAALGNGSNKAGAAALDQMRAAIRAQKRAAPNDKIPPKAKNPLSYLPKNRS